MAAGKYVIRPEMFDAVLFDLDGVVTNTASTHAMAWKLLFDEYLKEKSNPDDFVPFDIKADYANHVDGKPRNKGVEDFLASRNIEIPHGADFNSADEDTICGLGSRKNRIFSGLLEKGGVGVYEATVQLIEQLKQNGFKTAIVSSSKNCRKILKTANLELLFDIRVDGLVSESLGLVGKPQPDIFLEAARRLDVGAARCVVVEDACSGVAAGKTGGFGLVIGVNRLDQAEKLKQSGAHLVVNDLSEVTAGGVIENIPNAEQGFEKIMEQISGKEVVVFIEEEGCLFSKAAAADTAGFHLEMKKSLTALAAQCNVVVVCQKKIGRVKKRINNDAVYYAARDGSEIRGPAGFFITNDRAEPGMCKNGFNATAWVLKKLHLISPCILPLCIGTHVSGGNESERDGQSGLIITLEEGSKSSNASYRLQSPDQMIPFLFNLSSSLTKGTGWDQVFVGFDPKDEGRRETLCAMGNGYFVTRGTAPEAVADDVHYPGAYLAGGYNRLKSSVRGVTIENEDLVNIPNWLCLNFRISGDTWFDLKAVTILFYRQCLDMKKGTLSRTIRFRDKNKRETILFQQSFVHGEQMHLAGLKTMITPLNWDGEIEVCSALDARVTNRGVERYRDLGNKHLDLVDARHVNEKSMILKVRTNQSCLNIAMGARTDVLIKNQSAAAGSASEQTPEGYIAKRFHAHVERADTLIVEKLVSIYTSRDTGIFECLSEAENTVRENAVSFESLSKSHSIAWEMLWREFDIKLELDNKDIEQYTQKNIRLYIFHLLQSSSVHSLDIDVGMPARGWHGEGYRGHIFWDEIIIFPFLNYRAPRITKTLLMYRYRRLKEARRAAAAFGCKGAMYPWQSGSNGREETQQVHLNPDSGRWILDHTHLQRHVNTAIVYNIWQYFQITHDIQFLSFYGGEIIIEIARFWASVAHFNPELERYEILGVMGPDEFHDAYPGAETPGLKNNSYTNIMVMFVMNQALNIQHVLPRQDWAYLKKKLGVEDAELALWKNMSRRMRLVFHKDGIITQFEGYEDLKELDWERYIQKYGNIRRLDRILEKEGDSTNNYKLCKQPDVLMLFYLFSAETLKKMFKQLDYKWNRDLIRKNINYYLKRTTNGSSLALVIHAWIEARQSRERSWKLFSQALETDMLEDSTGSIREGIHLAAMSGCIDILQRGYAGLEIRSDILILNPLLPKSINRIRFHIRYRKHWLDLEITQKAVIVKSQTNRAIPFTMMIKDEIIKLYPGSKAVVDI